MRDSLDLDTTPVEEQCQQVGPNYDPAKARLEAQTMIAQLQRKFGSPPDGVRFKIKSNPHDFGSYYSIEIIFDGDNESATDYAYKVEGDFPEYWDDESKKALGIDPTIATDQA